MESLDKRIVRTRRALADSLITLSLERGYENLTIKMVTDHAGVGNRTFYRHFLSLDDLLTQIMTTALQELKERALEAETLNDEVRVFYFFVRDHQDLLRVYVNLPWTHPARQAIVSEAARIMQLRYARQSTTGVPLEVTIDLLVRSTNHLVSWYLDHIDECTPEQAADIHDDLVVHALEPREDWMQRRHQLLWVE